MKNKENINNMELQNMSDHKITSKSLDFSVPALPMIGGCEQTQLSTVIESSDRSSLGVVGENLPVLVSQNSRNRSNTVFYQTISNDFAFL